ncbi:MAG: WbqC family protein [Bdellovibrionota bacterium]
MILTAHQPVYLPWLGLFQKIALADHFVIFDQVQYLVKDWNNRNKIKTPTGPIWLSVPVLHRDHYERKICEIEIDNSSAWARKHLKSIQINYAKAPHLKRYLPFFEETYSKRWNLLTDLNNHMLKWFLDTLGIRTPITSAGQYHFEGAKSALVLDMCLKLKANVYIFGGEGESYADKAAFEAAGVSPVFQSYVHPVYKRLHGEFASHMSIIDLLFNHGDESLEILMSGNPRSALEIPRSGVSLASSVPN